jgi:L-cysteine S-thiosulfotransferase
MVCEHYRRHVWLIAWAVGIVMPFSMPGVQARDAMDRSLTGAASLTGTAGDPERGRVLATDSAKGNCIICHALPVAGLPADAFGDLGPSLAGVGSRLSVPALRQRIVDPRVLWPQTVMPAYFVTLYTRVQPAYAGKTILSAQEVEDVVAYLASLK